MATEKRLIDANELKQRILAERDKIPHELPSAVYEFGIPKPNHHGDSMRGGIRKALRCLEQCKKVDAVPVVRCKDCKHYVSPHEFDVFGRCTNGNICVSYGSEIYPEPNDFCSYGERKGNG
jgi:hypothetical protein